MAQGRKTGGRRPGSPNKVTKALKDAILLAADNVGRIEEETETPEKGRPVTRRWATHEGGLVGYLEGLATHEPVAFSGLLGRVLPLTLAGDPNAAPIKHIFEWAKPSKPSES